MTAQRILLISILAIILLSMYRVISQDRQSLLTATATTTTTTPTSAVQQPPCVPTFVDGGGPYYQPDSPFRYKIVPDTNKGKKLTVEGKIVQSDCKTPVANAVLDIWQANETGDYQDQWYRGKVRTDDAGNYAFETVVPKGYGEGTGYRPSHIHFKVFVNDAEIITSQMLFPEAQDKPGFEDAYIMKVETTGEGTTTVHRGLHTIILPL